MEIREAGPEDFEEVARCIRELAAFEALAGSIEWEHDQEQLRERLFGPTSPATVLLAEEADGEVAGFALYYATFSTFRGDEGLWLEDLFVREAFRGRGYGQALLAELRARSSGRIEWRVLDWNERAIAFYEALGAQPVDGWRTYRWLPPSNGS